MTEIDRNEESELSLVKQTIKKILQYIAHEGLSTNSVLPKEAELCEQIGVSRVVIREALSQLRAMGFIETKRKRGSVLVMPEIFGVLRIIISAGALDRKSLKDLYELRLMLEIGMSDFVYRGKNPEALAELERLAELELATDVTEELIKIDIDFHGTLYKMTGNSNLVEFHQLLVQLFNLYLPRMDNWRSKQPMSHLTLTKILKTGNADMFRSAMRLHLTTQFENMDKILDKPKIKIKSKKEIGPIQ